MKVSELIEALSKLPPDMDVVVIDDLTDGTYNKIDDIIYHTVEELANYMHLSAVYPNGVVYLDS